MNAFDRTDLEHRGFVGFLTVHGLRLDGRKVPARQGVYVVIRESLSSPDFLDTSPASWFKGQDPTVPLQRLRHEWVKGTPTLYFGSAADLEDRLGLLGKFSLAGRNQSVFHRGGRLLWQLSDAQELLVGWRVQPDGIGSTERDLVLEFKHIYRQYPFANLKLPAVRE